MCKGEPGEASAGVAGAKTPLLKVDGGDNERARSCLRYAGKTVCFC